MTDIEKRWRQFRESIGPVVAQEDALSTSMENRHPVEHHNHKRGVNTKHLPTAKVFKPEKTKTPLLKTERVHHGPEPGEIPIKQWAMDEAKQLGVTYNQIWSRIKRGKYPGLKRRWVNARIVFVTPLPFVPDI